MTLFDNEIYTARRNNLKTKMKSGIALFIGNQEEPYNYSSNTYKFRQDSDFSYFFGLNEPGLAAIIDFDEDREIIFGNNIDMEDIIWMGYLPKIEDRCQLVGVAEAEPLGNLSGLIHTALGKSRKIHFLPPYRASGKQLLSELLSVSVSQLSSLASVELIQSVIALRLIKSEVEIADIERMVDVAYKMHTTAMKMAKPGISEKEIVGTMEGIAAMYGNGVSFPVILSMNGEILHNHSHNQILENGRLLVVDAGSESDLLYASDITRTLPVGGRFDSRQRDIYQVVLNANTNAIAKTNPNTLYKDIHLQSAQIIAEGLKNLGLMKGDIYDAVSKGAHALFFPHGLGHALGMDVHDMEGLGENNVGYDHTITRSEQFGLAYLRFGKKPQPGNVLTVEPGIYFIPALIDEWKKENKFTEFINYDKVETYKDFGGIRIEDDILVTTEGCRVLGKPIPKTVHELESVME